MKIWYCLISCLLLLPGVGMSEEIESIVGTHQQGRFTVEVLASGGQRVVGGEFTPSDFMPHLPSATLKRTNRKAGHVIFINYKNKELQYYRLDGAVYRPVIGFAVVTPEAEFLPHDIVRGEVTQIVAKPTWCPKVGGQVRKAYPDLPPGCLPYGHPLNLMGDWRFDIDWNTPGWSLIRLHGTTGYPQGEFWEAETFGCTRLENDAISRLVEALGQNAVSEGIEVIAHRTSRSLAAIGR